MNVLADFHHPDLWWSLHLLFEKRLGWSLYRPIGMDWFNRGYHHINDEGAGFHSAVELSKYLLEDSLRASSGTSGYFEGLETQGGCKHFPLFKVVRFCELSSFNIDFLVCSTRCSEKPMKKLQQDFFPGAKIIRQVGNWLEEVDPNICPNVLCSDRPSFENCKSKNKLFYHQEFDLGLARYEPPDGFNIVSCFIHHFFRDKDNFKVFEEVKKLLPDWEFLSYGKWNTDGHISCKLEEVKAMRDATFIWQTKYWDGYGFNIHRAYALGRPVICNAKDYVGKTAEPLLEDGKTCIFIEPTLEETADKIRYFAEPKRHRKMCESAYRRFREVVDFDKEFVEIKKFLDII